jgi:hypothetical protein
MATQSLASRLAVRRITGALLLLLVLALAGLAWFWRPLDAFAETGAAYGARLGCTCHFIGGRSLTDCRKDFERHMGLVRLSEDRAARSVTGTFPLLSSQTATLRDGAGCMLEKYQD